MESALTAEIFIVQFLSLDITIFKLADGPENQFLSDSAHISVVNLHFWEALPHGEVLSSPDISSVHFLVCLKYSYSPFFLQIKNRPIDWRRATISLYTWVDYQALDFGEDVFWNGFHEGGADDQIRLKGNDTITHGLLACCQLEIGPVAQGIQFFINFLSKAIISRRQKHNFCFLSLCFLLSHKII